MNAPGRLRDAMPLTSAFIDELRDVFGADAINAEVRKGMQGIPGFYACENGIEVGTRMLTRGSEISVAQMVLLRPKKEAS